MSKKALDNGRRSTDSSSPKVHFSSVTKKAKKKKVRFVKNIDVVLFDRIVSLDRFPYDGEGFPVGMDSEHFHRETQPLVKKTKRRDVRLHTYDARRQMLEPYVQRLSPSAHTDFLGSEEEMRAIRRSRQHVGCSCEFLCFPDTCECLLNGISCRETHLEGFFSCQCSSDMCGISLDDE